MGATFLFPLQHPPQKMTKQFTLIFFQFKPPHLLLTDILYNTPLHNSCYPLLLTHSVYLRGCVSGCRRLAFTHTNHTEVAAVQAHTPVAFCWRDDWIRLGADSSAHWLILPAALQSVTAFRVLLLIQSMRHHKTHPTKGDVHQLLI